MKRRVLIIVILFCLIICCSKITYSLFHSETFFKIHNMEIAEFIFETERTDRIELNFTDLKPGDTQKFKFQVSNTKDNNITNVTTEYQITIKTFHFMPLVIELYKDNETDNDEDDELVMKCDEKYSRNADKSRVCNTDVWEMGHSSTKTENFIISVSFPKEFNTEEYMELVDYIDLDIASWQ